MSVAGMAARQTVGASDIELVRATRADDDGAFEELYRRYRGPIAGYVRSWVNDDGRAEDVAQEAFMAAFHHLRQTEGEITFKPWIYKIAKHAAIDQHRRRSRVEEVSIDADGGLAPADTLRLTASGPPEASVIDKERFDHFRGALEELSGTQQRILVLRELEGLSYREIGERMQLSSAAVESALFRARRKLEGEYEQLSTGRRCLLIRSVMARMAEGIESRGDRRRLDRHSRRCWTCCRQARQLGLEPAIRRSATRRAVALLPLPAFLRRFVAGTETSATGTGAREAAGILASPGFESVAQVVHKAVVVLASAIAIGGGGATLGGVGPLGADPGRTGAERPAMTRDSDPARVGKTAFGPAKRSAERTGRRGERGSRSEPARSGRRGGAEEPSAGGGAGGGRLESSARGPSQSAPSRSELPSLPALPRVDGQRAPAPPSGVKSPAPPRVPTPSAELPRLPAAPAAPMLPAGANVDTGPMTGAVPDPTGATRGLPPLP